VTLDISTRVTSIFASPHPPPRRACASDLSLFVLAITGVIFAVVATLLGYALVKFGGTTANADHEPPQVYGSTQIELAWTIIPS
jgi:cytochrome c oxidase subunit 2